MARLSVTDRNGVVHVVEGTDGRSVMETLRDLDFGVAAICGGMCSCATCHVYVDPSWLGKLTQPASEERELLSELAFVQEQSRLSCQIELTAVLDGISITVAPEE